MAGAAPMTPGTVMLRDFGRDVRDSRRSCRRRRARVDPTMRSRSSPCTPVISASAMISAITPTPTPTIDTAEMSEMNAWRRRAVR